MLTATCDPSGDTLGSAAPWSSENSREDGHAPAGPAPRAAIVTLKTRNGLSVHLHELPKRSS